MCIVSRCFFHRSLYMSIYTAKCEATVYDTAVGKFTPTHGYNLDMKWTPVKVQWKKIYLDYGIN